MMCVPRSSDPWPGCWFRCHQGSDAALTGRRYFPGASTLGAIKRLHAQGVPSSSITFGFGAPPLPGHENSTCESCSPKAPEPWLPGCATYKNCCGQSSIGECCGCWLYDWNQTQTRAMIDELEAGGVNEIFIWRGDNSARPGTSGGVPRWFVDEMARFLKRGEATEEGAAEDHALSLLNPGYGGRASPSKRARKARRPP